MEQKVLAEINEYGSFPGFSEGIRGHPAQIIKCGNEFISIEEKCFNKCISKEEYSLPSFSNYKVCK